MSKVYIAGHTGLVGSALMRRLPGSITATRRQVDLRNQQQVNDWFRFKCPDQVYLVAGTVGGIMANSTRPAEFLYDNLMIHANVLNAARDYGTSKVLYLGSSCIYPRDCTQPIIEEALLTGPLEPTNEPYALAKIAGVRLCQAYRKQYGCNFISAMPTNLYGTGDNFDLTSSHVIPALMRKIHEARRDEAAVVWGTGTPRREFLHVDDLADACIFLMNHYDGEGPINVGTGEDVTIREVAEMLRDIICPGLPLRFDSSKPDGTPRKLLDVTKLHNLGWQHRIPLQTGLQDTYAWYREAERGQS